MFYCTKNMIPYTSQFCIFSQVTLELTVNVKSMSVLVLLAQEEGHALTILGDTIVDVR